MIFQSHRQFCTQPWSSKNTQGDPQQIQHLKLSCSQGFLPLPRPVPKKMLPRNDIPRLGFPHTTQASTQKIMKECPNYRHLIRVCSNQGCQNHVFRFEGWVCLRESSQHRPLTSIKTILKLKLESSSWSSRVLNWYDLLMDSVKRIQGHTHKVRRDRWVCLREPLINLSHLSITTHPKLWPNITVFPCIFGQD